MTVPRAALVPITVLAALAVSLGAAAFGAAAWLAACAGALAGLAAALPLARRRNGPAGTMQAPPPTMALALPLGRGRAVLEQLPIGLALLGGDGRVLFQNDAARDLLERDVVGLHCSAAFRAPALLEAMTAALAERRASEIDLTLLRATERAVHAHIRPLPDAASEADAPAVVVLLEDRTRMAKAEELRRDFVANASHELKTPLASITGFIETLQGHARDDPEAAQRFLGIMAQQAARMKRLVEDLLSLNRIEINEHVQPREPLDLAEVIWEVAGALRPLAELHRTRIEVALPLSGMVVRGDRHEIAQVFMNLIDNAIKYAGADGPIRVRPASGPGPRKAMLGVEVADAGPGIAREHLPRLTERFYRVNAARSRERGGTGLGLAIAKHVLNRHRGDLAVASVVGEGAVFTVWLPAFSDASQPPAPAPVV
ncbi:MAG: ATP-binding protein [Rubrimonas sp.]|uniref:ATP-binding protein n=1 Tax=Rubrimonas sp. TaxID=2036015 RepID=UPI002FDEC912